MAKPKSEPEPESEAAASYNDPDVIDPETGEDRRQVAQRADADAERAKHRESEDDYKEEG